MIQDFDKIPCYGWTSEEYFIVITRENQSIFI